MQNHGIIGRSHGNHLPGLAGYGRVLVGCLAAPTAAHIHNTYTGVTQVLGQDPCIAAAKQHHAISTHYTYVVLVALMHNNIQTHVPMHTPPSSGRSADDQWKAVSASADATLMVDGTEWSLSPTLDDNSRLANHLARFEATIVDKVRVG